MFSLVFVGFTVNREAVQITENVMSTSTKKAIKYGLEILAAIISAVLTALGTTSCMKFTGMI